VEFGRFFGREPLYFSRYPAGRLTTLDLSAGSYILMYMKYFSIAEFRANISKIIDSSTESHERVVITRNGEPAAIMLSIDDYESMTETMEILQDPKLSAEILEYISHPEGVEWVSEEEAKAAFDARIAREREDAQAAKKSSDEL
jgi:prevent-host-death family protein